MRRFGKRVGIDDARALHRWSVEEPDRFWREAWNACGVIGARGEVAFDPGDGTIPGARFFPEASLNLAENLLAGPDDEATPAIAFEREDGTRRTITWGQLRVSVAATAVSMRVAGVQPGDRVAAWMPNLPETVIAFLAASAVGAIFSSTSADFGTAGVIDRFGQIEPALLFAADGYFYGGKRFDCLDRLAEIRAGLPTVRTTIVTGNLRDEPDLRGHDDGVVSFGEFAADGTASLSFERGPFDRPAAILYSSGYDRPAEMHRASSRRHPAQAPHRAPAALRRAGGRCRLLLHDVRLDDVELARVRAGVEGDDRAVRRQPDPSLAGRAVRRGRSPSRHVDGRLREVHRRRGQRGAAARRHSSTRLAAHDLLDRLSAVT